jgi:hypothetical protein
MKDHVIQFLLNGWHLEERRMFRKTLAWKCYFFGLKLRLLELDIWQSWKPKWYRKKPIYMVNKRGIISYGNGMFTVKNINFKGSTVGAVTLEVVKRYIEGQKNK